MSHNRHEIVIACGFNLVKAMRDGTPTESARVINNGDGYFYRYCQKTGSIEDLLENIVGQELSEVVTKEEAEEVERILFSSFQEEEQDPDELVRVCSYIMHEELLGKGFFSTFDEALKVTKKYLDYFEGGKARQAEEAEMDWEERICEFVKMYLNKPRIIY